MPEAVAAELARIRNRLATERTMIGFYEAQIADAGKALARFRAEIVGMERTLDSLTAPTLREAA